MKKRIALILCVVLLFCIGTPAFAAQDTAPFILVSGMNVLPLYLDNGTESGEKIWPIPGSGYAELGRSLVKPMADYMLTKDKSALYHSVLLAFDEMLEYMKCDENGDSLYPVFTPTFETNLAAYPDVYQGEIQDEQGILNAACRKYGAENVYFFNYDWRLDPLDHADTLCTLIETAKREHQCEKVNLACASMGGLVVTSYLYKYGSEDLRNLILLSTAFQGVEAVGEMYCGELYVDKNALMRRVIHLGKRTLRTFLFEALMYACDETGIADGITGFANRMLDDMGDDLYDSLLKDVFAQMPAIMDLVPEKLYEGAKANMLDSETNAALIARTDTYIYHVQTKAKALLDSAKQAGTNVYLVCQYNLQALPVSRTCDINNDLLIDVTYASGGAVCADLESTLPAGYTQQIDDGHDHISPDFVIDASTCIYPENTWFIKDQAHVDYNVGPTTDFIFWLADSETQVTVFDLPQYSQFMAYDYDANTLTSMDASYRAPVHLFSIVQRVLEPLTAQWKTLIRQILQSVSEVMQNA